MRPWIRRGACSREKQCGLNSGLGIILICPDLMVKDDDLPFQQVGYLLSPNE